MKRKAGMARRVLSVLLALVMCLGMLPVSVLAEGTGDRKNGTEDRFRVGVAKAPAMAYAAFVGDLDVTDARVTGVAVEYSSVKRDKATITYTVPGKSAGIHAIALVDVSIDNDDVLPVVSDAFRDCNALMDKICYRAVDCDHSGNTTARTIIYQHTAQDMTGNNYSYNFVSDFGHGVGQSNELAALDEVLSALDRVPGGQVPVLFWVLSPDAAITAGRKDTAAIKAKLDEVREKIAGMGGELITWQMGDTASDWLEGDRTQVNHADAGALQERMYESLEKVVSDGVYDFNFTFTIPDGMKLAMGITDVSVRRVLSVGARDFFEDKEIIVEGRTATVKISKLYNSPYDIEFAFTMELDTDEFSVDTLPAPSVTGTYNLGVFDSVPAEYPAFKEAVLDRTLRTVAFKASADAAPDRTKEVKGLPGEFVLAPDASEWTTTGQEFSGWARPGVADAYIRPGEQIEISEEDMDLTALWGHVDLELLLGDAERILEPGNRMKSGSLNVFLQKLSDYVYGSNIVSVTVVDEVAVRSGWYGEKVTVHGGITAGVTEGLPNGVYIGLDKNNPVVAYVLNNKKQKDCYDLYLAGYGGVTAPDSLGGMFSGYPYLKRVDLRGLDTSNVTNMSGMFSGCQMLTSLDLSSFDTSNVTDMSYMFDGCYDLTRVDLSSFDTSNVTNMHSMFCGSEFTSLDLSGFDTSNVTDMHSMFFLCKSLASVDLSSFDTSNVTDMSYMFSECSSLTSLDLGSFDTFNVTDMSSMFNRSYDLTSLDLSSFDTSNVTNMISMFYGCSSLASLDLSSFDTSNVTYMGSMFYRCSSLTSLDLSSFDTSKVTDMDRMFSGCSGLTSLDLSSFDTSNVTSMSEMFGSDRYGYSSGCSSLASLDLSGFDTSKVTDMDRMFSECFSLANLDLSSFDTSNVTDMSSMFYRCSSLTSLDLSSFDTSNVTNMISMFYGCSSLASLDLSSFGAPNVTNMSEMFYGCSSLASLDLSSFGTSNVTNMSEMFYGCSSLASLDLSSFDTSKVTYMGSMFSGCSSLASIDLSSFDTSKVTYMRSMFSGCSSLISLDLSSFDTSKVTDMRLMFSGCSSLASLDLSSFDTSKVTDMYEMFYGCEKLCTINFGDSFYLAKMVYNMFEDCHALQSVDGLKWKSGSYGAESMKNMFKNCRALARVDLSIPEGKEFPKLSDITGMFEGCTSLSYVDLSGWELPNLSHMDKMFYDTGSNALTVNMPWDVLSNSTMSVEDMVSRAGPTTLKIGSYAEDSAAYPQKTNIINAFKACTAEGYSLTVETDGGPLLATARTPMLLAAAGAPGPVFRLLAAANAVGGQSADDAKDIDYAQAVPTYKYSTPVGSKVSYIVRIKYDGTPHAQSGQIDVRYPLPEGVGPDLELDDVDRIEVGRLEFADGTSFTNKDCLVEGGEFRLEGNARAGYVLVGSVRNVPADAYIDVNVKCVLTRLVDSTKEIIGGKSFWYWTGVSYAVSSGGSVDSNPLRLWYAKGRETPPKQPDLARISYRFTGDVPDGITPPETEFRAAGGEIVMPAATVPEGYEFEGWYREDTGSPVGSYTVTEADVPAGVTFYGRWKLTGQGLVTIIYKLEDGGYGIPESLADFGSPSIQIQYGRKLELLTFDDIPPLGFLGWTKATLNGVETTVLPSSGTLDTNDPAYGIGPGDTIVYTGSWGPRIGTVRFDANGGRGTVPEDITVLIDAPEGVLPGGKGLSKAGYEFTGWSTNRNGKGYLYQVGASVSHFVGEGKGIEKCRDVVTLYAVWDRIEVVSSPTKTVATEGSGYGNVAEIAEDGQPYRYRLTYKSTSGRTQDVILYDEIENGSESRFAGTVTGVDTAGYGDVPVQVYVQGEGIEPDAEIPEAFGAVPGGWKLVGDPAAFEKWADVTHVAFYSGDYAFSGRAGSSVYADILMSSTLFGKNMPTGKEVKGVSVKFAPECRTGSTNGDCVEIYYEKDGAYYKCGQWGYTDLANKTVNVPSSDFWLYWRTDDYSCNYYGFDVASVEEYEGNAFAASTEVASLPDFAAENTADPNALTSAFGDHTHGNYGNNVNKLWYFTGKFNNAIRKIPNDMKVVYANTYVDGYQVLDVDGTRINVTYEDPSVITVAGTKTVSVNQVDYAATAEITEDGQPYRYRLSYEATSGKPQDVVLYDEIENGSESRFAGTVTGVDLSGYGDVPVQVYVQGDGIEPDASVPEAIDSLPGGWKLVGDPDAFEKWADVTHVAFYSGDHVFESGSAGSSVYADVLMSSTTGGKNSSDGKDVKGVSVKFGPECKTESAKYDYVAIYYRKDGAYYKCGPWGGTDLANKTVNIPSPEFWLYWRTDGITCNYYGFDVVSVEEYDGDAFESSTRVASLPNFAVENTTDPNALTSAYGGYTHGNYGNYVNKLWHFTGITNAIRGIQNDMRVVYVNPYVDGYQVKDVVGTKINIAYKDPSVVTTMAAKSVGTDQSGYARTAVIERNEQSYRYRLSYALASGKTKDVVLYDEIENGSGSWFAGTVTGVDLSGYGDVPVQVYVQGKDIEPDAEVPEAFDSLPGDWTLVENPAAFDGWAGVTHVAFYSGDYVFESGSAGSSVYADILMSSTTGGKNPLDERPDFNNAIREIQNDMKVVYVNTYVDGYQVKDVVGTKINIAYKDPTMTKAVSTDQSGYVETAVIERNGQPYRYRLSYAPMSGSPQDVILYDEIENGSKSRFAGTVTGVDTTGYGDVPVQVYVQGKGIEPDAEVPGAFGAVPGSWKLVGNPDAFEKWADVTHVAFYSGDHVFESGTGSGVYADILMSSTIGGKNPFDERPDAEGASIKFGPECQTESVDYDYVEIYYQKDGAYYKCGPWGGTDLANRTVNIPSTEFWLYWCTDSGNCNYYGFDVASVEEYDGDAFEASTEGASLPNVAVEDTADPNALTSAFGSYTHGNYGNYVNKLWRFTGNFNNAIREIQNDMKVVYTNTYVDGYQVKDVEGTKLYIAYEDPSVVSVAASKTVSTNQANYAGTGTIEQNGQAYRYRLSYALESSKTKDVVLYDEIENGSKSRFAGTVTGVDTTGYGDVPVQVYVRGDGIEPDGTVPEALDSFPGGWTLVGDPDAFGNWGNVTHVAFYSGDHVFGSDDEQGVYADILMSSTMGGKNLPDGEAVAEGISIKFGPQCQMESAKYDYVMLCYQKDGVYYECGPWGGTDLANRTVNIPSPEFWLYWHTDSSNCNYYGFDVVSVEEYQGDAFEESGRVSFEPDMEGVEEVTDPNALTSAFGGYTHGNYGNNVNKFWYFTFNATNAIRDIPNDMKAVYTNIYSGGSQVLDVEGTEVNIAYQDSSVVSATATKTVSTNQADYAGTAVIERNGQPYRYRLSYVPVSGRPQYVVLYDEIENGSESRFAGTVTGVDLSGYGAVPVQVYVRGSGIEPDASVPEALDSLPGGWKLVEDPDAFGNWGNVTHVAFYSGDYVFGSDDEQGIYADILMSSTIGAKNPSDGKDVMEGVSIKFGPQCETESVKYDYVEIYYQKDGSYYECGPWGGTELANKVVNLPSPEFWLRWRTDGSSCSYYGFDVASVEKYEGDAFEASVEAASLPDVAAEDAADPNELTSAFGSYTHGNYGDNVNKLWHYTGNFNNAIREIPNDMKVAYTNAYIDGYQVKNVVGTSIEIEYEESADVPKDGPQMPKTGGTGTAPYIVVGSSMVLLAGLFLAIRKKRW